MGKHRWRLLKLCLAIVMLGLLNGKVASAESIVVKEVQDIDNVISPDTSSLTIAGPNLVTSVEFKVPNTGKVKSYIKIGVDAVGFGKAWISKDGDGDNILGDVVDLKQSGYITVCLDAGTYYLQLRWSQIIYNAGVAIVYEKSTSDEDVTSSNLNNANMLALESYKKGFLTANTPKDYYEFQLEETAYLDIQYSFDTSTGAERDTAELTLYNSDKISIGTSTYDYADRGMKSAKFKLEPGIYYLSLTGFTGDTALYLKPMYYRTSVIPDNMEWTNKNVSVKIDTTIEYTSIDVIKYDVTEEDLRSNTLWNTDSTSKKYVETNGTTFVAKENGIYSIRIKDDVGEYILKKIEIKNIDKKAPTVTGIKNGTYYRTTRTIKWSDQDGSGVKKVTLNGKTIKNGVKVSAQGEYTLKIYDKVGNKKTITFCIDKTKPTIHVTQDQGIYGGSVVNISDDYTGIKQISINGEVSTSNHSPYYYYSAGTYIIKAWDNAGNTVTKTIQVK